MPHCFFLSTFFTSSVQMLLNPVEVLCLYSRLHCSGPVACSGVHSGRRHFLRPWLQQVFKIIHDFNTEFGPPGSNIWFLDHIDQNPRSTPAWKWEAWHKNCFRMAKQTASKGTMFLSSIIAISFLFSFGKWAQFYHSQVFPTSNFSLIVPLGSEIGKIWIAASDIGHTTVLQVGNVGHFLTLLCCLDSKIITNVSDAGFCKREVRWICATVQESVREYRGLPGLLGNRELVFVLT